MTQFDRVSVYIHIPFCTTKCTYCAFNTYTNLEHLIPAFMDALNKEIASVARAGGRRQVGTIFFGGGTPSLLTGDQFSVVLDTLHSTMDVSADAEITLEANPNDLTREYAASLRDVGFNRISIGMQSASERELMMFRRRHDTDGVASAVSAARGGGFQNINLDLIYGIPDQTLEEWENSLRQALNLHPHHISLYALGVEENTPMYTWVERGIVAAPDDDLAAEMYELASAILSGAGYAQYEISNWALPGYECRHNLQYWRNLPYLGFGPGAHGYAESIRYATVLSPHRYVRVLAEADQADAQPYPLSAAVEDWNLLDKAGEISDTLIMGLRLVTEGIELGRFRERFAVDLLSLYGGTFEKFEKHGLVNVSETHVRLTERGRLLSNMVFRELV